MAVCEPAQAATVLQRSDSCACISKLQEVGAAALRGTRSCRRTVALCTACSATLKLPCFICNTARRAYRRLEISVCDCLPAVPRDRTMMQSQSRERWNLDKWHCNLKRFKLPDIISSTVPLSATHQHRNAAPVTCPCAVHAALRPRCGPVCRPSPDPSRQASRLAHARQRRGACCCRHEQRAAAEQKLRWALPSSPVT
jgi:hypothetical protein